MSDKFEAFKKELEQLCKKHGVIITPDMYDSLEVWDAPDGDNLELERIMDDLRDRTK